MLPVKQKDEKGNVLIVKEEKTIPIQVILRPPLDDDGSNPENLQIVTAYPVSSTK